MMSCRVAQRAEPKAVDPGAVLDRSRRTSAPTAPRPIPAITAQPGRDHGQPPGPWGIGPAEIPGGIGPGGVQRPACQVRHRVPERRVLVQQVRRPMRGDKEADKGATEDGSGGEQTGQHGHFLAFLALSRALEPGLGVDLMQLLLRRVADLFVVGHQHVIHRPQERHAVDRWLARAPPRPPGDTARPQARPGRPPARSKASAMGGAAR